MSLAASKTETHTPYYMMPLCHSVDMYLLKIIGKIQSNMLGIARTEEKTTAGERQDGS